MLQTLKFIATHPLSSQHRVAAMARYLRWQVESRIRSEVEFDWIGGAKLVARNGMTGATGNIYCGLHEFVDMAFLLHVLRPDDLFLDVGANVGSYTVLASAVCKARTIAVEPDPDTVKHLRRNIDANRIGDRVRVVQSAVGAQRGVGSFTVGHDTTNQMASPGDKNTREVNIMALDEVVGDESPILLKMDVEGYEPQVIAGAIETIKKSSLRAVITETADKAVSDALGDADFMRAEYDPFTRNLKVGSLAQTSTNTLFVRGGDVLKRLQDAPKIEAAGVTF